jgi:hypothetical protein
VPDVAGRVVGAVPAVASPVVVDPGATQHDPVVGAADPVVRAAVAATVVVTGVVGGPVVRARVPDVAGGVVGTALGGGVRDAEDRDGEQRRGGAEDAELVHGSASRRDSVCLESRVVEVQSAIVEWS